MTEIHLDYTTIGESVLDDFSRDEAAIMIFREFIFLSGADNTACLEFSRLIDAKKHNNPFVVDLDRELVEYFNKKPNRCKGDYDIIKVRRLSEYRNTAVPQVNYNVVTNDIRFMEPVYITPPDTPKRSRVMKAPTPVRTRTGETYYKTDEKPIVVETNTGLILGALLVGGVIIYASA